MTPRAPLILDTDGGVDDAQALMMLIAAGVVPEAITTVFGNVGVEAATRNILAVLAAGRVAPPVHRGQAGPLVGAAIDATHVHGEDGLGGAPRPAATGEPAGLDAVAFLRARLTRAAAEGPVDLLMIGPLTNLALALRLDPGVTRGIGRLTIMGGTLFGRGNTTPAAEFNILADPEAAAVVFAATIPITLVPWEPCTTHDVAGEQVDEMLEGVTPERAMLDGAAPAGAAAGGAPLAEEAEDEWGALAQGLADHARRIIDGYGHGDRLRFVDHLAAALAIDPGLARRTLTASVDVALAPGLTRGMTVVDPSGRLGTPPVTILETADLPGVTHLFAQSLRWRPPARA